MPRKRKTETSPIYGSFLISLLYRSLELLDTHGRDSRAPETLDKLLGSIFNIPEIKEMLETLLEKINSTSEIEWRRSVRSYFKASLPVFSRGFQELGMSDPLQELSPGKQANWIIKTIGWEGSFNDFASKVKKDLIKMLILTVSGEKEAIEKWSKGITAEVFKEDPEKAITLIRLSIFAGGGKKLLQEIEDAVRNLLDKLRSSPEFQGAVELVEKHQEWGGLAADRKFQEIWDTLRSKIMGRVWKKGLAIPKIDEMGANIKENWNEEESVALYSIFDELSKRASENPFKLIADALTGKLGNSLVLAAENDIRDKIRYEKAQKRDVSRQEPLDEEKLNAPGKRYPQSITVKSSLDKLIEKEGFDSLMNLLTNGEKAICNFMVKEDLTQTEIGRRLDKPQSWVNGKIKKIRAKLEQFK